MLGSIMTVHSEGSSMRDPMTAVQRVLDTRYHSVLKSGHGDGPFVTMETPVKALSLTYV